MMEMQKPIHDIEEMFRIIVCNIFGIDSTNSGDRIRFAWGSNIDQASQSAPNLYTTKDICIIQITPIDDNYNRQRDLRFILEDGEEDMTAIDEHTDVHNVLFINYGNNAYDCARKLRNGLYTDSTRRFLRLNKFAMITSVPAIRRVPELVNANWINRVDVLATFNQFVRLTSKIGTIDQIGITTIPGTWPDGSEDNAGQRIGVNIMQENGNIIKLKKIREE